MSKDIRGGNLDSNSYTSMEKIPGHLPGDFLIT